MDELDVLRKQKNAAAFGGAGAKAKSQLAFGLQAVENANRSGHRKNGRRGIPCPARSRAVMRC